MQLTRIYTTQGIFFYHICCLIIYKLTMFNTILLLHYYDAKSSDAPTWYNYTSFLPIKFFLWDYKTCKINVIQLKSFNYFYFKIVRQMSFSILIIHAKWYYKDTRPFVFIFVNSVGKKKTCVHKIIISDGKIHK